MTQLARTYVERCGDLLFLVVGNLFEHLTAIDTCTHTYTQRERERERTK